MVAYVTIESDSAEKIIEGFNACVEQTGTRPGVVAMSPKSYARLFCNEPGGPSGVILVNGEHQLVIAPVDKCADEFSYVGMPGDLFTSDDWKEVAGSRRLYIYREAMDRKELDKQ